MKTIIFPRKSYWLFIPILLVIFSCTKKPDSLGLDLVDGQKAQLGFDTVFNIYAYSEVEDSVPSDETSINILGSMQTATFGRLDASFYTHLRLSQVNPDFGTNPEVDSIVLSLVYKGYYGNLNTQQSVTVHRVKELIYRDSSYYSNNNIAYYANVIGSKTYFPKPADSILIDSVLSAPELRIPLDNSFGQKLLDLDSTVYVSSAAFQDSINGIYVQPEPESGTGAGGVVYYAMLNDRTNVTLYYHNDNDDSLSYNYLINESCARIGKFSHDYSLSSDYTFRYEVAKEDPDSALLGRNKLYLQGLGGVKTVIYFPQLKAWAAKKAPVINEAKLIISSLDYNEELYPPPDKLILFKRTEEGKITFTDDQSTFDENHFGGSFNEADKSYMFRITLHIQNLLNGDPDYGLVLYPNAQSARANGLVFYGTDQTNPVHLQLKLIYTYN